MPPKHIRAGAVASVLASLALAAPGSAAQPDLRSPDARATTVAPAPERARFSDLRTPDAHDAGTAAPTIVEVSQPGGFDWGSAGIGAAALLGLVAAATGAISIGSPRRALGGSR